MTYLDSFSVSLLILANW